jgi:hypothetical protein
VGLNDSDASGIVVFGVGTFLISFHIACFCLVRKYRKATTDAYGAIDGQLVSINSCLDANN